MFEDALLIDAAGRPTMQHHQAFSRDWDRIKEWSDNIYMPYTVTPMVCDRRYILFDKTSCKSDGEMQ